MLAAALSAIVSGAFALVVFAQYRRRGRPYQEMWAIGLAMFAVAALAGALARNGGATEAEYRLFYLFGAILNVLWLALGTLYITARRAVADASLVAAYAFSVVATLVVFTSPVDLTAAVDSGRGFQQVAGPRILAGISNTVGSVVLIGGALLSAWAFLHRRHEGRRAIANVVIAIGVLIVAAGGTVTFAGGAGILEWTNLIGVTVMFAGFVIVSR